MTLLYDDPCFLQHETGPEIERSARLRAITHRLEVSGLAARCQRPEWKPVSRRRLTRNHSPAYIDSVVAVAKSGGGPIEQETTVSPASEDVARLAAGCVCDAVERLVRGEDKQALCLVRPPGHHAMFHHAMGFCIYNNVAIAAKVALEELGLDRLLIVDWDIHHGNGTQAVFWEDPRVGFLSIHRWPFYPGSGRADETGGGPGSGATVNLPIEYGTPRAEYLEIFSEALEAFAAKIKPQLVLISAGFDAHRQDPIGDLGLETEDFIALTGAVLNVAETYAGGLVVSVLEGGYDPPVLAECVEAHLREMLPRT
ncbi:MAG: histone deacetylase [Pirellulales bacterium]|nr:histone deacetylase [Pirellulales bacterium]